MRKTQSIIVHSALVAALSSTILVTSANAGIVVSADMDPTTTGIQPLIYATAGQVIPVDIVVDVGQEGLSSYGVSIQFDTTELSLFGDSPATESLPDGFGFVHLTPGVAELAEDIGGGLGQVLTFEAATFGAGPTEGRFVVGTVNFLVDAPVDDGLFDVTPGLFNTGIDGVFDNGGMSGEPVFVPGSVVPEPSCLALLAAGVFPGLLRRRRS